MKRDFRKVIAVSHEISTFPNGDLAFFTRNGYTDKGVISEEPGYCKLHLVEKELA